MQVPEAVPWLREYAEAVNSELQILHPQGSSDQLESAIADALSVGGKRVRATLALLWCEAHSGDYRPAIPLAAAYELAHASALVQDDIMDHSEMRRGSMSIQAKYGISTALLASNLLLFNVPKMVARYDAIDSGRLARIFDLVGEACRATTWGEFLDMELARGGDGSEDDYVGMMRLKTSSLLSAPCASGALVGGASEEQVALAGRFGEELGIAYQIRDDSLDLVGDESTLGKPTFTDLRGGKKSIILLHCMRLCSADDRAFIVGLLNRTGPYSREEKSRLMELIELHGSLDYASEKALSHTNAAVGLLGSVPESRAKSRLMELANYLAGRYY